MKKNKAFTLVELIIVIAIIAILAVTAFLLLTKRLAKARDASRSSNLANIENSLQISLTDAGTLPKPDNYTLIYASWTTNIVGYQWDFWEWAKDSVWNINSAPKDWDDYFTYYLSNDLKSYQLWALMENEIAYNSNIVSAVDYSSRFINVKGSELWMLFDSSNSPINKLGLTWVDIQNTTSSYTAYFDNTNKVSWTWFILKSLKWWWNLAFWLVGYWSLDEWVWTKVYDNSWKWNNWTLSWSTLPSWTGGKNWTGLFFSGSLVQLPNPLTYSKNFTISLYLKTDVIWNKVIIENNSNSWFSMQFNWNQRVTWALCYNIWWWQTWKQTQTSDKFNDYQWHNVVIIYDWTLFWKIYVDWINKTKQNTINWFPIFSWDIFIWWRIWKDVNYIWIIDEVRIYERALTESEVKSLYDATK